jgi:hypothetical protein
MRQPTCETACVRLSVCTCPDTAGGGSVCHAEGRVSPLRSIAGVARALRPPMRLAWAFGNTAALASVRDPCERRCADGSHRQESAVDGVR